MADAWDQFRDAQPAGGADPWAQFKDAQQPEPSMAGKIVRGIAEPIERVATRTATGPIDLVTSLARAGTNAEQDLRTAINNEHPGAVPESMNPRPPAGAGLGNTILNAAGIPLQADNGPQRFAENVATTALSGGWRPGAGLIENIIRNAGATAGGELGGYLGQKYGGEAGGVVGGMLGGMAPSAAARAVNHTAMSAAAPHFAREDAPGAISSPEVYDALVRSGITPRPATVGNQHAAALERSTARVPIIGGGIQKDLKRQGAEFDTAVGNVGDAIRGDNPATPTDVNSIGTTLQNSAAETSRAVNREIGDRRQAIVNQAGADLPVNVVGTQNRAGQLRDQGAPLHAGVNRVTDFLETDRVRTPQDRAADVPFTPEKRDVTLDMLEQGVREREPQLRTAIAEAEKHFGTTGPAIEKFKQDLIGNTIKELTKTLEAPDVSGSTKRYTGPVGPTQPEVPLEKLLTTRSNVGRDTNGQRTLEKGATKQLYGAITDDIVNALEARVPGLGQRFQRDNATEAALRDRNLTDTTGQLRFLEDIGPTRMTPDAAQRAVFGSANKPAPMEAVRSGDEGGYRSAAAAQYLLEGQAKPGATTGWTQYSPNTLLTNWNRRGVGGTQEALTVTPEAQARATDVATVAQALRDAGRQENVSNSASTQHIMGMADHPIRTLVEAPIDLIKGAAYRTVANSPTFAAMIAGRGPTLPAYLEPGRLLRLGYGSAVSGLAGQYVGQ